MRKVRYLAIVALLMWMSVGVVVAEEVDHGRFCFQLFPFRDILDMNPIQPDDTLPFFQSIIGWKGEPEYVLGGAGGIMMAGDVFLLHARFQNDTTFFGGNPEGHLRAIIEPSTLTGAFGFDFHGPNPVFDQKGQLFPVPCDDALAISSGSQWLPLAGEKRR